MEDKNKRRIRTSNQAKNIVRFIKSQRLRWAAHVIRMDITRTVKRLTEWEPCSSRPVGRPRLRWLNQVEENLQKIKARNCREKCKDRSLWNKIVQQAKIHQGL
jgi:seryl-tRNA(Sec) selenium transferase